MEIAKLSAALKVEESVRMLHRLSMLHRKKALHAQRIKIAPALTTAQQWVYRQVLPGHHAEGQGPQRDLDRLPMLTWSSSSSS